MRHAVQSILAALLLLASMQIAAEPKVDALTLKFDYAAVEGFLRAIDREALSEAQWHDIAGARGADAMVRNTIKYVPDTAADGYLASLRELAKRGALSSDPYWL